MFDQNTLDSLVDILVKVGTPTRDARLTVDVAHHATKEAMEAVRRVLSALEPDEASSALIVTLRMLQKVCGDEGRHLLQRGLAGDHEAAYDWIVRNDQP